MTITELVDEAHRMAKWKGWWDEERSALEIHALVHSEIAEATECVRRAEKPMWIDSMADKPEGELVELADAIIRIADWCGHRGWNLEEAIKAKMAFNETRPYKHGKVL